MRTEQPCPWCGPPAASLLQAKDLNRRTVSDWFTYYRCRTCAVVFLEPVPTDLSIHYPASYHDVPTARRGYAPLVATEAFKIAMVVANHEARGRLLDIGPGGGAFACLAQDAGFDVEVLEAATEVCLELERVLGVRAHRSLANSAAIAGLGPYDVITMWQVAEHLEGPRAALDAAAGELAPGGLLVVAAPNPLSLQFRLLGSRWPHLDAPRHLRLIPVAALEAWSRDAGLEVVLKTYTDSGSLAWNRFGWVEWADRLLPHRDGPARWYRGLRRGFRLFGSFIERLVQPVERRRDRGATYTVVFRRPSQGGSS